MASGTAIIRELAAAGIEAGDVNDIIRHVRNGDPQTTTRVRTAGRILRQTLSTVVNFINPDVVVLGGGLSQVEPYVTAVRSQLYESCHPLATKDLTIEQSLAGSQAGLIGQGNCACGLS